MSSSHNAAAREAQAQAALRNLQHKKPVPEIDFTIHTMDDGTTASTLERYSKGSPRCLSFIHPTSTPPRHSWHRTVAATDIGRSPLGEFFLSCFHSHTLLSSGIRGYFYFDCQLTLAWLVWTGHCVVSLPNLP